MAGRVRLPAGWFLSAGCFASQVGLDHTINGTGGIPPGRRVSRMQDERALVIEHILAVVGGTEAKPSVDDYFSSVRQLLVESEHPAKSANFPIKKSLWESIRADSG
jgi:hypothetical protein